MPGTGMHAPYKARVAEFFDARSGYGRSELHARMAERFLDLAAPQPGERVLDIASGTGFVAIPAARLVGDGGQVVGVDISEGMLAQAAAALAESGLDNLDLRLADAEDLDFPAASFDLVTCCNALPYMADVSAALRRWHALLRPGGRLVFNCWAENSHATGHLLRSLAGTHGIYVSPVGHDTGTPERCHALLAETGCSRSDVIVEPTSNYLSAERLNDVLASALKSPLFGIAADDAIRIEALRNEYLEAARSMEVLESLEREMGAYFVVAYR